MKARLLSMAVLAALVPCLPATADIVHLKNGGTITADAIEDRGESIIVHQGKGRIVVPRGEIASIERTAAGPVQGQSPAAAPAAPSRPGAATPSSGGTAGTAKDAPPAGDAAADERALQELRTLLLTPSLARDENRRQITALLDRMGERSLVQRQPDEARRRFEEALTWNAGDRRGRRGLAAALLALDRPDQARSIAERALVDAPDDPDLLTLLGEAAARQDRAPEAIALWERAYAARPETSLRERIDVLKRQSAVDAGYVRSEAARFTVAYDGSRTLPELEADILAYLNERYADLVTRFDFLPARPVAVVIYPERDFYAATQADSDVAGLFDGTIRVPCGGLHRLDPQARAVLVHELAHAFIAGKSAGAAPRWLHEGLAQYIEGARTDPATARALGRQFAAAASGPGWGVTFSYPSSLSLVEFLVDRFGFHSLNETLRGLAGGRDPDAALKDATGFGLDDLRRQWGDDLARRLQ